MVNVTLEYANPKFQNQNNLISKVCQTNICNNPGVYRAHICHEYHELYSWRKKLSGGEISAFHV